MLLEANKRRRCCLFLPGRAPGLLPAQIVQAAFSAAPLYEQSAPFLKKRTCVNQMRICMVTLLLNYQHDIFH
jgi:hypothetical protein